MKTTPTVAMAVLLGLSPLHMMNKTQAQARITKFKSTNSGHTKKSRDMEHEPILQMVISRHHLRTEEESSSKTSGFYIFLYFMQDYKYVESACQDGESIYLERHTKYCTIRWEEALCSQRLACLAITGAMKTTPTVAMAVLLGLPPFHVMNKAQAQAGITKCLMYNT
jgi:hypothetical protein